MSRRYRDAARVLAMVQRRKGGLKSLTLGDDAMKHKRMTYALVAEAMKYADVIAQLLQDKTLKRELGEVAEKPALLQVLLYDHLFGKGIEGGGKLKRAIVAADDRLQSVLGAIRTARGVASNEELLPEALRRRRCASAGERRYVRVNRRHWSVEEALAALRRDYAEVSVDKHIDDLLVLPAGTDLHAHAAVVDGRLVLQGKSSCIPAHCLASGWMEKGDVIDACAAPGNKTGQLAVLRLTRGHVYAFDKSVKRCALLRSRMQQQRLSDVVHARVADFLTISPSDPLYMSVRAILLDPSCSGSGMHRRVGHAVDARAEEERVAALAAFQKAALLHAFSFPQVRRISYSTCSVHHVENEAVVAAVLAEQAAAAAAADGGHDSHFVLRRALPQFEGRGEAVPGLPASEAEKCVRASPDKHGIEGFFVALFVRKKKRKRKRRGGGKKKKKSGSKTVLEMKVEEEEEGKEESVVQESVVEEEEEEKKEEEEGKCAVEKVERKAADGRVTKKRRIE